MVTTAVGINIDLILMCDNYANVTIKGIPSKVDLARKWGAGWFLCCQKKSTGEIVGSVLNQIKKQTRMQ